MTSNDVPDSSPHSETGPAGTVPDVELHTVRSGSSRALSLLVMAITVVFAVSMFVSLPIDQLMSLLGLPVLIGVGAWVFYWHPAVRLSPDALTLVDPLKTTTIPWQKVESFDVRFGLRVNTVPSGSHGAWALPPAGRRAVSTRGEDDGRPATVKNLRMALRPHMPETLRRVIEYSAQRTEALRKNDEATLADVRITSAWNWTTTVVLLTSLVWAAWSVVTLVTL